MSGRYTESIDPIGLAAQGRGFEGRLELANLPRLRPLIKEPYGDVEFSLHFAMDEGGIPCVHGEVKAVLVVECQRCMEDMELPVSSKIRLGIASSRAAVERMPDKYEPLLVGNGEISISSIVEDELILALPIVAMHKPEDCKQWQDLRAGQNEQSSADVPTQDSGRKNPFAILAKLKEDLSVEATEKDED